LSRGEPLLGFTGEARRDPGGVGIANGDSDRTSRVLVRVGVTGVVASALEETETAWGVAGPTLGGGTFFGVDRREAACEESFVTISVRFDLNFSVFTRPIGTPP